MTDLDDPLPAPRVSCFTDERSFREQLRGGDHVRAAHNKQQQLTGVQYLTKGAIYRVLDRSDNDGHFFFRTTTDLPNEVTYLCWSDLDMTSHD